MSDEGLMTEDLEKVPACRHHGSRKVRSAATRRDRMVCGDTQEGSRWIYLRKGASCPAKPIRLVAFAVMPGAPDLRGMLALTKERTCDLICFPEYRVGRNLALAGSISVCGILLGAFLIACLGIRGLPSRPCALTRRRAHRASSSMAGLCGRGCFGARRDRGRCRSGPTGQEVEFEFSPPQDEPAKATMHFRFGQTPGEIWLDDLHVRDLTAGQDVIPVQDFEAGMEGFQRAWTFWPPGEQNTVGTIRVDASKGRAQSAALRVTLRNPPDGHWPDFHIYHHANLGVAQRAPLPSPILVPGRTRPGPDRRFLPARQTFTYLGGPPSPFGSQIKLAAGAGVDFVSFPVGLPWPKPGEPVDWTGVDAQCQTVLDANPQALLLPRIGMEPPALVARGASRRRDGLGPGAAEACRRGGRLAGLSPRCRRAAGGPGRPPGREVRRPHGRLPSLRPEHGRVVLSRDLGTGAERLRPGRPAGLAALAGRALRQRCRAAGRWHDPQVTPPRPRFPRPPHAAPRRPASCTIRRPAADCSTSPSSSSR